MSGTFELRGRRDGTTPCDGLSRAAWVNGWWGVSTKLNDCGFMFGRDRVQRDCGLMHVMLKLHGSGKAMGIGARTCSTVRLPGEALTWLCLLSTHVNGAVLPILGCKWDCDIARRRTPCHRVTGNGKERGNSLGHLLNKRPFVALGGFGGKRRALKYLATSSPSPELHSETPAWPIRATSKTAWF